VKKSLRMPSPALVISVVALFVALGGTSYAAITGLPANSVGTAQLKNNAVTAGKLAKSITLAPGHTEKGVFGLGARGASEVLGQISFPTPLASVPKVQVISFGNPNPAGCTGTLSHPAAVSGHLCIYEGAREGGLHLAYTWNPVDGNGDGSRLGAAVYAVGGGSGFNSVSGTWAVTG
jgi:hypothetical protein